MVTTTTTTTFSMNREMAKGICQHFMDARLIENAADMASTVFKDKGVYVLTPKGLHILERFITKNGINGEHLLKVFSSQPICMKLLHLERRSHDDELLINRPVIEVIFRRFVGRAANYAPKGDQANGSIEGQEFDRTMGIEVEDITEKAKGSRLRTIKHTFPAIAALDWLCDFTTICGRDEAAEIAAHFVRLGLIDLVVDRARKDPVDTASISVRGDDGSGRITEGEFKCHYKAIYGLTDRGRGTARWEGYRPIDPPSSFSGSVRDSPSGPGSQSRRSVDVSGLESPTQALSEADATSMRSGRERGATASTTATNQQAMGQLPNSSENSVGAAASQDSKLNRRVSAAERLRNEYLDTGNYNSRDSNTNRLKQILEEPALRSLFREFLKQNFCEENLSFWLDVQDFKRRFHTTSSATAVKPGEKTPSSSGGGGMASAVGRRLAGGASGKTSNSGSQSQSGYTAMERHQQDLIAMAFVIYNTYLAPASPCELNIEHNLRSELVSYMNKVLNDAKGPDGEGLASVNAKDYGNQRDQPPSSPGWSSALGSSGVEERRAAVQANVPRAPLHASQLQMMVRLYERIQDHIFRLMATDSVPRFIKDTRFLNLVKSVEVSFRRRLALPMELFGSYFLVAY